MDLLLVRRALDLLAARGLLRGFGCAIPHRHGAAALRHTLLLQSGRRMVLAVRDESERALRCRPRVEALDDVALHSAMSEVNVALVVDLTIDHRANQVG